jgi:hypothetical protein
LTFLSRAYDNLSTLWGLRIVFYSCWQDRHHRSDPKGCKLVGMRQAISGQVNHEPFLIRSAYRVTILFRVLILLI